VEKAARAKRLGSHQTGTADCREWLGGWLCSPRRSDIIIEFFHAKWISDRMTNEDAIEDNKKLVTTFLDTFNTGNITQFDSYVAPDLVKHLSNLPNGAEASRQQALKMRAAYPKAHVSIKRVIAEGDLVAVLAHATLEPDTKGIAVIYIFRIEEGRIAEQWEVAQPVPETSANNNTAF
jgi:predicted SnoaL-like aldol condensation-catalyzing enzyme